MRGFGTLVLAFLLSGSIASAVQLQLGVYFKADLELVIAMVALAVMTPLTSVALGVALALARKTVVIDAVAGSLLGLTVLALAALLVFTGAPQRSDLPILAEIVVPIVLMVAIQWWLVRRRFARGAGAAA